MHLSCQWRPASVHCGLGGWACWWLSACFLLAPTATWTLTTAHTRGSEPLCPPGNTHTMSTYTVQTCTHMERWLRMRAERLAISYLIVQVIDLQLIAPSTVGEVETAVFFRREQLCVSMLLKGSRQVNKSYRFWRTNCNKIWGSEEQKSDKPLLCLMFLYQTLHKKPQI